MALFTSRLLCLLVVLFAVTQGLAKSIGKAPELVIDSSVKLGRPILDETIGPMSAGQNLSLTCTLKGSLSASLSWWENGNEVASVSRRENDISGASITLHELKISDSGRRLTCREKETGQTKLAVLLVVDTLDIVKGSHDIIDGEIVQVENGAELMLNCILQAYSPASVSWFEEDTELPTVRGESSYARSSLLSLPKVTAADSDRNFTCRSQGQELPRTIRLKVNGDDAGGLPSPTSRPEDSMTDIREILKGNSTIFLIVACVSLTVVPLFILVTTVVVRCNKTGTNTDVGNTARNNIVLEKGAGYVAIPIKSAGDHQKGESHGSSVVSSHFCDRGYCNPISEV